MIVYSITYTCDHRDCDEEENGEKFFEYRHDMAMARPYLPHRWVGISDGCDQIYCPKHAENIQKALYPPK